jgi:hypothetical protein
MSNIAANGFQRKSEGEDLLRRQDTPPPEKAPARRPVKVYVNE